MSDTSQQEALSESITRFTTATNLADDYTKGDDTLDVVGSAGTYPSLAKLSAQALTSLHLLQALTVTNVGNNDMVFGQAVYSVAQFNVDLANASSSTQKTVIGLVAVDLILSQSGTGSVLSTGLLTGSVAQWEAATGMVGGLVEGLDYFLDTTAGHITPFPPSETGQFLCPVGHALSTTQFSIRLERPIAL